MAAARDIMSAEVRAGRLRLSCQITVEDENHVEMLRVPFKQAIAITGA